MLLNPVHHLFHVLQLFPVNRFISGLADSQVRHNDLGVQFIHGNSRSQDAAAHIGDPGQFQKPLDRAVLAVQPVKDREHDIHPHLFHLVSIHK